MVAIPEVQILKDTTFFAIQLSFWGQLYMSSCLLHVFIVYYSSSFTFMED